MKTLALATLCLALTATVAQAQTKTGQFAVRAQVNADCTVTTRDMDFAVYNPGTASRVFASLDVKCTKGSAVTISLDGGTSGNPQARTMTGQGSNLGYQLYRDAAYQDPINTAGAAWQITSAANDGNTKTFTMYGDVPANQAVPSGNYNDVVRVTVQY